MMKNATRFPFKTFLALVLVMLAVFAMSTTASAEEQYLVHRSGYLAPGGRISGPVYPNYGRTMGIIVGAGVTSNVSDAYLEFTMPPVYWARVYADTDGNVEVVYSGVLSSEYVVNGNTWILENPTNYTIAYTLAIIERW